MEKLTGKVEGLVRGLHRFCIAAIFEHTGMQLAPFTELEYEDIAADRLYYRQESICSISIICENEIVIGDHVLVSQEGSLLSVSLRLVDPFYHEKDAVPPGRDLQKIFRMLGKIAEHGLLSLAEDFKREYGKERFVVEERYHLTLKDARVTFSSPPIENPLWQMDKDSLALEVALSFELV